MLKTLMQRYLILQDCDRGTICFSPAYAQNALSRPMQTQLKLHKPDLPPP